MNKNIYIVNNRCITLCVFVFILILHINANVAFADVPVPTDLPETPIPTPTLSSTDYLLEQEENKFLDDQYGGYRSNFEKSLEKSKSTQRSLLDIYLNALGGIRSAVSQYSRSNITPSPTSSPSGNSSTGISSELQSLIPSGEPPAGRCSNLVDQAIANLDSRPANIQIYKQASSQTGVPWEAIAAIHYIETGGSFNPNGSCISGRAIGEKEPDNGNQRYSSLLETCVAAAKEFVDKKKMVDFVRSKNNMPAPNAYEMLAGQFASYNSPTQSECSMGELYMSERTDDLLRVNTSNDFKGYDFIYRGTTWPGIPDNGQCRPKGEKFVGDRHIYSTACLDTSHENMYFHFHFGGNVIKYENRVGALTLIRAIQKKYKESQNVDSTQPTISYSPPTGNFVYYNQCDPRYQNSSFGYCQNKAGTSVPLNCFAGCGPSSAAEIIATYANASYTPINAMSKAVAWGGINCNGSGIGTLYRMFNEYPDQIEYGSWFSSSGNFNTDAQNLKPHIAAGWTVLAAASYTPCCGHFIWVVDVDNNNNIWANDVYWFQSQYVGPNAKAPMNLTGFINGQYPYKGVTDINITGYTIVRKKITK